ncbi:hypothetical protein FNV43_RR14720 [Rhamnella rubrinervis]|uniref:Uncharacterized protein n=1 Tax=Rhamnella rubrinervis TaxID=2594499 RepID=A0A8K0H0Q9_9ROSA|nr:hypothetical protein FNV43_RR13268 [Rhamnella rubrinervis]KAF3445027.1 hypothetical protein FNV43_RR14720 [Rhamnella rubrinervis]
MMDMTDTAKNSAVKQTAPFAGRGNKLWLRCYSYKFCYFEFLLLIALSSPLVFSVHRLSVEGIEDDEKPKEPKDEKPKDDEQPKKGREFNILVLAQVVGDAITTAKDWVFGS